MRVRVRVFGGPYVLVRLYVRMYICACVSYLKV